ncbi:MAG: hypothetical protein M3Z10_05955 [Gemmatimonadota bacterium]|nr:hypothetical protein [Gemmatimonadota bacterium]
MSRFLHCALASALIALPISAHAQAPTVRDSAHRAMTKAQRQEKREEKRDEMREKAGKEAHPQIRAAIRSLERAKADLEHAAHDFGGHRADAVKAVDEAIRQLRLAMEYDKK